MQPEIFLYEVFCNSSFFFFSWSYSQQQLLSGVVQDENKTPLLGVSIIDKNTKKWAITDEIGTTSRKLAFEAVYQGAFQKDIIAKTLTNHSTLALSLLWAKEYEVDTFLVRPTVKGTVIFPLYNKLINQNTDYHKPYSESDYAARTLRLFYEEVVNPDHEFFHTTRYQFSLGADLKKRLSKQTLLITSIKEPLSKLFF